MISLILFDDVQTHTQLLEALLRQSIAEDELDAEVVLATTDANKVLEYARTHPGGGVYFLDIALEEGNAVTGVDVCRKVRGIDPRAYVVYVSAYPHYAMECIRSHAFDFLLKPFTKDDLRECLLAIARDKAMQNSDKRLVIHLGSGARTRILDPDDILYLSTHRNFIAAHLVHGEPPEWRGIFSELLAKAEMRDFLRITRSCAVNLRHIQEIDWEDCALAMDDANHTTLRVSRRMLGKLQNRLRVRG